ncbi:sigma-54 interaction domain-containing protein [Desulfofundulus thermosubterraneus]|uniref:Transcriptional regulator containing PAS, AAA-type ATPase, and DNA-binding Fis domains n=1 Tax=Desulfofundulus thermosubterraneus DSM 16057 TaxID=1121432 RepID=A0A1M6G6M4_9FIRM|nr:sigma 54-interacting transcriptional regulator [Desulfofundulus thermosubterraneus]SHJ05618.1 Transcriptional regulator containing PAS, AAA-type ATPase, and DNA-binding Fis domains [Desulfofundulus thermosubterraneus DSM 16057]
MLFKEGLSRYLPECWKDGSDHLLALHNTNLLKSNASESGKGKGNYQGKSLRVTNTETGLYYTNGQAYTLGVNSAYECLTGLHGEELFGRNMNELVDNRYFDRSVSLMVLEQGRPVTIPQHVLKTGQKVMVTGNPVFDEEGKIFLVVTTVKPLRNNKGKKITPTPANHLVELEGIGTVVAESEAMKQVVNRAIRAAYSDATVLIQGESGVGKEVVARIIHEYSPRKHKPFVVINAAAIPGELFEAELFGYRPGAFTGARREGYPGLVKVAEGGTLFLDEISEVPFPAQVKLLRLIQNKEFYPLGGGRPEKVDVRIVAASNQDLAQLMREGRFRQDLYYRLNVIPIYVPPLAHRREDIIPLASHFFNLYQDRYNIKKILTPEACRELLGYRWPGNVRELQNLMERLVVLSSGVTITARMVARELEAHLEQSTTSLSPKTPENLEKALEAFEKDLIKHALQVYSTQEEASRALGIHRSTLARKIKKYFS